MVEQCTLFVVNDLKYFLHALFTLIYISKDLIDHNLNHKNCTVTIRIAILVIDVTSLGLMIGVGEGWTSAQCITIWPLFHLCFTIIFQNGNTISALVIFSQILWMLHLMVHFSECHF